MSQTPVMLTIAGSDPSGGAGIQADLKTASALGVHAATVVTAVTVQNSLGVTGIHPVPVEFIREQFESVVGDLDVRAVKIGMLGSVEVVEEVAEMLRCNHVPVVVLDPVMVATSGDRLVPADAVDAIREALLPMATVVTPNVPEAAVLTGHRVESVGELATAGQALLRLGATHALVKGGHLSGLRSVDVLVSADGVRRFDAARIATPNTHGTGCTLSSAVAAHLVRGESVPDAVAAAKDYLSRALAGGALLHLGRGNGPVDHLVRA